MSKRWASQHRQFLKHILDVRGTATPNLPNDERLIQCACVEGLHDQAYCLWNHRVQTWLQLQPTALNIEDEIYVSTVIDNAKNLYRQAFHLAEHKVGRYWQMLQLQHHDCVLAPYLSALKHFRNRRQGLSADSYVAAIWCPCRDRLLNKIFQHRSMQTCRTESR